jgi:hypothetical protein
VIAQNVAMTVVHRPIVQQVAHTVTVTHVRHQDQLLTVANVVQVRTVQQVVPTVTETHVRHHVHLQIVHVAITHSVAIAHAQAMIAERDHLRATANAAVDQIVQEVGSPMIAKSVHAVVLAKSA